MCIHLEIVRICGVDISSKHLNNKILRKKIDSSLLMVKPLTIPKKKYLTPVNELGIIRLLCCQM